MCVSGLTGCQRLGIVMFWSPFADAGFDIMSILTANPVGSAIVLLLFAYCASAMAFYLHNRGTGFVVSARAYLHQGADPWTLTLKIRNRGRGGREIEVLRAYVSGFYGSVTCREVEAPLRFEGPEFPYRMPGWSSTSWTACADSMKTPLDTESGHLTIRIGTHTRTIQVRPCH
jgi:hypothetical protein